MPSRWVEIMKSKDNRCLSYQGHPEYTYDFIKDFLKRKRQKEEISWDINGGDDIILNKHSEAVKKNTQIIKMFIEGIKIEF